MDRVVVVTGAAGAIGCAIARKLAAPGVALVLVDLSASALDTLATECVACGAQVMALGADITVSAQVRRFVEAAVTRFGRIDGFVGNAGISGVVEGVANYPEDVFAKVMDVNVLGTFHCLKHAMPALSASRGSFVVVASTSAIRGRALLPAYVASKHAVLGLARSAALEFDETGVRVNAVLPGPIDTPMIDSINAMAARHTGPSRGIARAGKARLGRPQDVANVVAFVLSDDASHMNGAALVVDAASTVA